MRDHQHPVLRAAKNWALRAGIVALLATGLATQAAHADFPPTLTLRVNTTADDASATCLGGPCSLRGAVATANSQAAGAVVAIVVPAGHYVLSNGALNPNNNQVIYQFLGAGAISTIVDGSGNASNASDFVLQAPTQMSGFTITGGTGQSIPTTGGSYCGTQCGGGLAVESTLTLTNSVVTKNNVGTGGYGGGIWLGPWYAPIHMTNVQVTYNSAYYGGGIYNHPDTVALDGVTVSHNIACSAFAVSTLGPLDPHNVCTGTGYGGGIYSSEIMTLNGGSIANNIAGSLITDKGKGGGIYDDWRVTLNNVAVMGNIAGNEGGGFYNSDEGAMIGGSLSNNTAGQYGGGWGYDGDHSQFTGTGISGNTAGGTFACTYAVNGSNQPTSVTSCTRSVGTTANPVVNGCPQANSATYQCASKSGEGGGINSYDDILMTGGSLTGNVATGISGGAGCTGLGGGIYEDDGTNLAGAIVQNNGAVCGGGVFADEAPLITNGGRFSANHATYQGGAIRSADSCAAYTCTHGYLILTNPFITLNRTEGTTGGVYTDNAGDLVIQGSPLGIQGNIAPGFCKNSNNPCF